jgi:SAM-dependent methyltransferase
MPPSAPLDPTLAWYDAEAAALLARYEAIDSARLHAALIPHLPAQPAGRAALDVGAGTGRDAAWLAGLGWDVLAAEPAPALRALGEAAHAHTPVRWIDDRLPDLAAVRALGRTFDLILLSAVWMHLPQEARPRAFAALAGLLAPGGVLSLLLRNGPAGAARRMWPTSSEEIAALAEAHVLTTLHDAPSDDQQGRAEVTWRTVILRRA